MTAWKLRCDGSCDSGNLPFAELQITCAIVLLQDPVAFFAGAKLQGPPPND